MSKQQIAPPAGDPSPDTIRQYLAATAQRELDALRAQLDERLSALEAAIARPDQRGSLERLVLDLARVATAEAQSAAARATLEAQLHAQERAAASATDVQRALDAERSMTTAVGLEVEQLRTALETEGSPVMIQEVKSPVSKSPFCTSGCPTSSVNWRFSVAPPFRFLKVTFPE